MGTFVKHIGCDKCGSTDANALYDDGSTTCFSCSAFVPSPDSDYKGESVVTKKPKTDPNALMAIARLPCVALTSRGIRQDTCEYFGVRSEIDPFSGQPKQTHYPYGCDNKLKAYKSKTPDKGMWITGDFSDVKLFGQNKCRSGGKLLMITEGEEDCMIAWQMLKDNNGSGFTYNVTSIQSGVKKGGTIAKELLGQLEFIERFDKVVLCFDQDEPGREYAQAFGKLLTPGKARVMTFSEKDPCDMYRQNKVQEFITAFNNPEMVKSEGVLSGNDISDDELLAPIEIGYQLPFPRLNDMTHGLRKGELIVLTGASGLGKTSTAREIGYAMTLDPNERVANVMLEEGYKKTAQGYIAMDNNIPLGIYRENPAMLSYDKFIASKNKLISNGRSMFYTHLGSMSSDTLIEKLKFFRYAYGCERVILDHISLVVSGQKSSKEGERKDIDMLMTKLFSFAESSGTSIIAIVHLSRNNGKTSFNEGGAVSLNDLRGSASLEQLSHGVWAIEGDQQGDDPNKRWIRVLKNREFGECGLADELNYNPSSGRILPVTTQQIAQYGF